MPVVEYVNQPLPDREEFRRALREAREAYDPLEELLRLHSEPGAYERQYQLSSDYYQQADNSLILKLTTFPHHKHIGKAEGEQVELSWPSSFADVLREVDSLLYSA